MRHNITLTYIYDMLIKRGEISIVFFKLLYSNTTFPSSSDITFLYYVDVFFLQKGDRKPPNYYY